MSDGFDGVLVSAESGFYDLDQIAQEIHREYFPKYTRPEIQWGKRIRRKRRSSIRLGSYHRTTEVIRIHPLLDSPEVPHFFIQSIVFHEFLHHVLGGAHNRRFHSHERRFRYHREAREWLKHNLPVLLGHRARPVRSTPPQLPPPSAFTPRPQQLTLW